MDDCKLLERLMNRRDRLESPSSAHELAINRVRELHPTSVLRHWDALDLAMRLAWELERQVGIDATTGLEDMGARTVADQAVSLALLIAQRMTKHA